MEEFKISFILSVVGALFLSSLLLMPQPTFAASFDGIWKISRTGVGCTPTGLISIRVKRGKISGSYIGGSGKHNISGSISTAGSFKFTARSRRDNVIFTGVISGKSGYGKWNVSGRNCGGFLKIFK